MSDLVVDASVVAKWYLPEGDVRAARQLWGVDRKFHVPDLVFAEMANVLWKRITRRELTEPEALIILKRLRKAPLKVQPTAELAQRALSLAAAHGITAYDACYLALAIQEEVRCYTADRKFFETVRRTPHRDRIAWIDEPPPYVM